MNLLFAIFFGAGVAAWSYTKVGRRTGYSNTKEVSIVTGVIFIISTIVFYTILTNFIPQN